MTGNGGERNGSSTVTQPRPRVRAGRVATDLGIVVVLLVLLVDTLDLSEGARRFPFATILVLLALLAIDLLMELFPAVRKRLSFLEADVVHTPRDVPEPSEDPGPKRYRAYPAWAVIAWLAGLGALMVLFGYVIATPVFLLAFFAWTRAPWIRVALPVTLIMTALNYFVFYELLRMV